MQNELEHLGYLNYQLDSAGDYDSKYEIWMENETHLISIRNEKKAFEEGLYMSEYRIHELETLSLEAVLNASDSTQDYILKQGEKYDLAEVAVVKVDVSWEHNPRSLDRHPQFGNGRYIQYYIVGRSQDDSDFKLCEIFWEDGYHIDMQSAPSSREMLPERKKKRQRTSRVSGCICRQHS